jgi:hypothetical protein
MRVSACMDFNTLINSVRKMVARTRSGAFSAMRTAAQRLLRWLFVFIE